MRLVAARVAAARTLVATATVTTLVATVLVTFFLQFAVLLPDAGVRTAIAAAPLTDRTLLLSSGAGDAARDIAVRDRQVRDLLAGGLAGLPWQVHSGGYAVNQQLPEYDDADAVVAFLPELSAHATLVDGAWPASEGPGEPVQVALPEPVADELELTVGDTVVIHHGLEQEDRPAVLVGVWRPHVVDSGHWRVAGGPTSRGGVGPFVVDPEEFAGNYRQMASLEWVAEPDPGDMADLGLTAVVEGYRTLAAEVVRHNERSGAPLRVRTDVEAMASRLDTAAVVHRSGLVLPVALLAAVATYALILVARLLSAQRRGEVALLRARGASRRQLAGLAGMEAGVVVLPAGLLGAPLGTWLMSFGDRQAGEHSLGLATDVAPYGWVGPPLAWVIAIVVAACCALALVLPAAGRGRTWLAEQQQRSRPGGSGQTLRAGVDIALVVLALGTWTQLRQYGAAVGPRETVAAGPRDAAGLGVDPLLVTAPVLAVLAGTAVVLRLLPLITRVAVRLAERGLSFARLLGTWQADRRPHAGPVLLLVLAVATVVLAPSVAGTWQQSQRDQAAHAVGADLRLHGDPADAGAVADLAGVREVVAADRARLRLPEGGSAELLALDTDRAAAVALVRGDLIDTSQEAMFDALAAARPSVVGSQLPAGARRLVGEVRFTGAESVAISGSVERAAFDTRWSGDEYLPEVLDYQGEVAGPAGLPVEVHVATAEGLVHTVSLDRLDSDGVADVDVLLPHDSATLVGVTAQLRVPELPDLCPHLRLSPDDQRSVPYCVEHIYDLYEFDPMEVSWQLDLEVVDASGARSPLPMTPAWDDEIFRAGQPATMTAEVDPVREAGRMVTLRGGAVWPEVDGTIPAVASPELFAATGRAVGDLVVIGGVRMELVGTVTAIPGTADGPGVIVDLAHLTLVTLMRMENGGGGPQGGEWWVTSADPAETVAAAQQRGLVVVDRDAEERRLLDDPLGAGLVLTLWVAAAGAALLAAFGLAVDARATAVGRQRELAVLHTLGVSPPALSRSLVVEQAVLAGLGVLVGLAVGVAVAATMGTSLVLTGAGTAPVPEALLLMSAPQLAVPTVGLFALAITLSSLVARRARRELAAGGLRIGTDSPG